MSLQPVSTNDNDSAKAAGDQDRSASRLGGLIERLDLPLLALAGLSIVIYLAELKGLGPGTEGIRLLFIVTLCIDLIFVLDLALKCLVLRGSYARSPWFLIDLLSTLPILASLALLPEYFVALRFVRALRLLRVLRALRMLRVFRGMRLLRARIDQDAQVSDQESRTFDLALTIGVFVFTLVFLLLAADLHLRAAAPAESEFYLMLGAVLGMLLMIGVTWFQIPALSLRQLRTLLNLSLPPQLAERLIRSPMVYDQTSLSPASVVFCDLTGFTASVEGLKGDLDTLKKHLEKTLDAIVLEHRRHDLIVDKLIGDAVMSFRGGMLVEGDPPGHAYLVVRATLDGMHAVEKLADPYFPSIKAGGATGDQCLIGSFGTSTRLSYTILGDAVNLASRLEQAAGACGVGNLFCEQTYVFTRDREDLLWRRFGKIRVKGKAEPLWVYEAFDRSTFSDLQWLECFHRGLERHLDAAFTEAAALFAEADGSRPGGDLAAQKYHKRSLALAASDPGPSWTGEWNIKKL